MTRVAVLALLALAFGFASVSQSAEDLRAEIEARNTAFRAAFLAQDAEKVASFYTADAQVIAPGAPIASGRPAIAAFWKAGMAGVTDLKLETSHVERAGDLALEDGVVTLTQPGDAKMVARYLVVWKRETGQWKLHRDIWNSAK